MKKTLTAVVVVVLIVLGIYWLVNKTPATPGSQTGDDNTNTMEPSDHEGTGTGTSRAPETVIGKSVQARDIVAYNFGTGDTELLFVGGIHGGYSWNTALVAFELVDYLKANPEAIPSNVKVTVIPVLNPDGLAKVTGKEGRFTASDVSKVESVVVSGRFNANNVDINRNFDCDWQSSAKWQNKTVSGGNSVFSEPETKVIRDYAAANKISAVVAYYSSAGGVYASSCHNGVSVETEGMTASYAGASGYPSYKDFNFYEITGDMVNWFAKNNVPAISVLLTNHTDTEWSKNKAGVEAIFKRFAK